MDDVIEDLVGDASARGFDLDFSLESLDVLERYLSSLKSEVLIGYSDLDIEFCPSEVVDNFLHDERFGLLRSAVEAPPGTVTDLRQPQQ
jgi:hypothetical protein